MKNKEEELSELMSKMESLNNETSKLRKEIDAIKFNSKIEQYNSYVGKYFIKEDKYMDISCIYCSSVDTEIKEIVVLSVHYHNEPDNYYAIQHDYFDPLGKSNWLEEVWIEIDKSEFYKHYNHVQNIINKKLGM